MRVVSGVVLALCCATVSVLPSPAGPVQPAPDRDLISFHFRNTKVSDVAQMIAEQGNVTVLVHDGGDVTLQFVALQDVTPEAALKQVALAAGLVLTRVNDATYILSKNGAGAPAAAQTVTPLVVTKPYAIRIRLAGGFTQEIQVQADDSFTVASTVASNEWIIRGTNKLEAGVMAIDLQIDWKRGQDRGRGQGTAVNRATTLRTQLRMPPDDKAMTVVGEGLPIVVSVRKTAP